MTMQVIIVIILPKLDIFIKSIFQVATVVTLNVVLLPSVPNKANPLAAKLLYQ